MTPAPNHFAPIVGCAGTRGPPPFAFCARESFRGAQRHPEHGFYEMLDGFAVYASFVRGGDGESTCVRSDERLGSMIDHVVPGP